MYSFKSENIIPSRGLACLIVKAIIDESYKWHRRLGHVNFKNLNKLVKGNLVRGLPSKIFQNDHTCVACQKGKQHKASYKDKTMSCISQPLQILHMDLFRPTSVRSLNHKTYCLVITDDFSRMINGTELRTRLIKFCGSKESRGNTVMPELHNKMEFSKERTGPLLRLLELCYQVYFYLTLFGLKQLELLVMSLNRYGVLESCPKHNMVAYLEKTDGNTEFHEIITILTQCPFPLCAHLVAALSISEASIRSDLLFDDADGIDSLPNQAIFDAIQLMGNSGVFCEDKLKAPELHKKMRLTNSQYGVSLLFTYAETVDKETHMAEPNNYITATRKNFVSNDNKGRMVEKCIVEIQGTFLEKIRNDAFNGNKGENAYEHINKFLNVVGPIKINGLTQDRFWLSIFLVSLTRAAYEWFTKECIGSITTWDSMIEKFIPKFYYLSNYNDDEDIEEEEDPNETKNAPKIFMIKIALFTRMENFKRGSYANIKTEWTSDPYLDINRIFGRDYEASNVSCTQENQKDNRIPEPSNCKSGISSEEILINDARQYITIKESEYLNYSKDSLDAYQELLCLIGDGWVMTTPDDE
ncbi:putative ribonuclease H-like domain-containing protein [Tanacetum coccineum]|uniref:Ribonuclease H-like domain-containing protein n=1 Tax=Tanacetum coccineum TaxID=301880 RepID=A0ABQ5BZ56_9ASTR